jgi:hypothetical protein
MNWGTYDLSKFATTVDAFDAKSPVYDDAVSYLKQVSDLPNTEFWHGLPIL